MQLNKPEYLKKWSMGDFCPSLYEWRIVEYIGLIDRYWGVYLIDRDKKCLGHFREKTKEDAERICEDFDMRYYLGWE